MEWTAQDAVAQILAECKQGVRTMDPALEIVTGLHDKGFRLVPSGRVADLEVALHDTCEAMTELMACSSDMLNQRVAKALYTQCHRAQMRAQDVLANNPTSVKVD